MLYDIRLHLHYDYAAAAGGGRHQIRVLPSTIPGVQRVIAASLSFAPAPNERSDFSDFFGNNVTSIAFRDAHDALDIRMSARVSVSRPEPGLDVSPDIGRLRQELAAVRSLASASPHHFLAGSAHSGIDAAITAYAQDSVGTSAAGTAMDLCNRIHRDFTYDGEATTVRTRASAWSTLRAATSGGIASLCPAIITSVRAVSVRNSSGRKNSPWSREVQAA